MHKKAPKVQNATIIIIIIIIIIIHLFQFGFTNSTFNNKL